VPSLSEQAVADTRDIARIRAAERKIESRNHHDQICIRRRKLAGSDRVSTDGLFAKIRIRQVGANAPQPACGASAIGKRVGSRVRMTRGMSGATSRIEQRRVGSGRRESSAVESDRGSRGKQDRCKDMRGADVHWGTGHD
jgi:hypothetical protein